MKSCVCETCGACCALWRVSFPEKETDTHTGGVVPVALTGSLNSSMRFMKGTDAGIPRCIALEGNVGFHVKCRIYKNRPSTCRKFKISWEDGKGNFLCDKARSVCGLEPFTRY